MKASIMIPKGWRRLRRGEIIREGDQSYDHHRLQFSFSFISGEKVGSERADCEPYIRKRAKPVQSKPSPKGKGNAK
jgi:hypothetical protein